MSSFSLRGEEDERDCHGFYVGHVGQRSRPTYKRIVRLDKFSIAQLQNCNIQWNETEGRAEALFALPEPCLAFSQKQFRARSI
jgi:hypothetical protein